MPLCYCPWPLTGGYTIPTPNFPLCSIMGPYQDIDPTNVGDIYYQLIGTSPCRMLVVSFYDVAYYGGTGSVSTGFCPSPPIYATSMIVLYENTNVIEIYIQQKNVCSAWNGGLAIEGIQDATGANAAVVPGRNNTQWTATNDAWRFTPNGAPNYAVSWWQGSTQISTNPTINVCPPTTTNYTAQIIYTLCAGGTLTLEDSATVTVNNSIGLTINNSNPVICGGGSSTLIANSTDPTATFQWSSPPGGASSSITVSPVATTTYTVTATTTGCTTQASATVTVSSNPIISVNSPSICIGQPATLNASGASSYIWNTGAIDSSITVSPASTTTYTVTGSNSGCTGIGTGIVTVNANLVPTITGPSSVCSGNIATLDAGPGYLSYLWSNSATTQTIPVSTSGTYFVTVTSGGGCSGIASLTVNVNPNPTVGISASINPFCEGISTLLTATGGTTYLWSGALGTANPLNVSPIANTTYTVTGSDVNGCTGTANITINVNPNPIVSVAASANPICIGNPTTLTAAGAATYLWSGGLGTTNPLIISPLSTITYLVTGTDVNGCTGTSNLVVTVNPLPNPTISPFSPATCGLNNGSATATGGSGYIWSNGQATATITGLAPAVYNVTVTSAAGCSNTNTVTIGNIPGPTVSATSTNENCGQNNGTATATPVGGFGVITYLGIMHKLLRLLSIFLPVLMTLLLPMQIRVLLLLLFL